MNGFRFSMGDRASLSHSGEEGEIVGRAEYLNAENGYLFRYKAGDGRQVEAWWAESAFA
jgi:hypothetical protein